MQSEKCSSVGTLNQTMLLEPEKLGWKPCKRLFTVRDDAASPL